MKKLFLAIPMAMIFLSGIFGCGGETIPVPEDYETVMSRLDTPEKIYNFARLNFRTNDQSDEAKYIQTQRETFDSGIVGCGDEAYFISKTLEDNGLDTYVLRIAWNDSNTNEVVGGHGVAVVKKEDGYHYIQPSLPFEPKISEGYESIEEMAEDLFKSMYGHEKFEINKKYTYFQKPDEFRNDYMSAEKF